MLKLVTAFMPPSANLTMPKLLDPITRADDTDPFAALHDLVWLHSATSSAAAVGLEARLYEVWAAHENDDAGVRLFLGLAFRGERATIWDLGCVAESAVGVSFEGPGHVIVAIEPKLDQKDPRRAIDVRYTCEGRSIGAILRVGSRLVARSAADQVEPFASVERVHDADLENDEYLHARLFERSRERGLLLQLSGPCGETRSFDLGLALEVSSMDVDDDGNLTVIGHRRDGTHVALSARVFAGEVEIVRIAETAAAGSRGRRETASR